MAGHTRLALALVILATLYVIFSNVCISIYARWKRELMWGDWEEELDEPPFIPFHQTDLGCGLIVVGALFCLGMAVLSGKTVVDSRKARANQRPKGKGFFGATY